MAMGMSENVGIVPGGYLAALLGSGSVKCPRPCCEGGVERREEPGTGRRYTIMCHFCKGHGVVSEERARQWQASQSLGPPSSPPIPPM
jgi:hypothetical protein